MRRTHKCLQCGGSWVSIVELPARCARCGTRNWTTKKPSSVKDIPGAYVMPERLPIGEPCWIWYHKGNASGGHAKVGGLIGISANPDSMPQQVTIARSHKGWEGD